ncbi:hypothetical protein AB7M17_001290 [Bradyrhizobium sp. USDA 377]
MLIVGDASACVGLWSKAATALSFPPPLRGPRRAKLALEVGERGSHELKSLPEPPPSLALPRKGGGNAAERAATFLPAIDGHLHERSGPVGSIDLSEVGTGLSLPPPLRGRVGERGSHELKSLPEPPPCLALPRKGGGNAAERAATFLPAIDGPLHERSGPVGSIDLSEVGTGLSLPPPLRGRVGERGSHELGPRLRPPLSLALPRKGGGNAAEQAARGCSQLPSRRRALSC